MKDYFQEKWEEFRSWFTEKEHPHSKLNKSVFLHDLLKLTGLVLLFLIVYNNVYQLNNISLWIIKLGGVLELVLAYFIIIKIYHLGLNLNYLLRGLNNGIKLILVILVILLIFWAYQNQTAVISKTTNTYDTVNWKSFSPASFNLSALGVSDLAKSLNTCPQINVSISLYGSTHYDGTIGNIGGKNYDGWTVKGIASCKKGSKESENLNKYYCGGYNSDIFGSSVNAYVEKTVISSNGDIGKTYKYIIWNIYDEKKRFVETRCLGDPDKFEEKQAQDFYNELLKWR